MQKIRRPLINYMGQLTLFNYLTIKYTTVYKNSNAKTLMCSCICLKQCNELLYTFNSTFPVSEFLCWLFINSLFHLPGKVDK